MIYWQVIALADRESATAALKCGWEPFAYDGQRLLARKFVDGPGAAGFYDSLAAAGVAEEASA
jgi:hypothetical protein